jgi:glycine cleavage system aminomethyltransferase T
MSGRPTPCFCRPRCTPCICAWAHAWCPFAGYAMPVQYPAGLMAEHRQCREAAALFDVSHMGQVRLVGADAAAALETLVPVDVVDLGPGRQRYAFFTNASGGLLDDLMIVRPDTGAAPSATCSWSSTPAARTPTSRHLHEHRPPLPWCRCPSARCWRCRARRRSRPWRG